MRGQNGSHGGPNNEVLSRDGSAQTFREPGASAKPKLLDQVRMALRTRHYSRRTEEAYYDAWRSVSLNQTMRKLKPGQLRTKKLLEKYGEKLVCVRYRYDRERRIRIKTVELVIETAPWQPPDRMTHIRINHGEVALGKKVRAAGGSWNRTQQVWELPYNEVVRLGLTNRIVNHDGDKTCFSR